MEAKRRGGSPARVPKPGERVPMSFRVTPEFKAKLDRAAKESGRSLAQEIELRLERSLEEERHLADALELGFGRHVAGLMLAIGHVMKEAAPEARSGELGWLADPELFQRVVESINLLLQAIDPAADPAVWASFRRFFSDELDDPLLSASVVVAAIADQGQAEELDMGPLIPTVRSWLGAAVIKRLREGLELRLRKE
jgi:predicted transcriptional regulator